MERIKTPIEQGRSAYWQNASDEENPYPAGTQEHKDWSAGWMGACDDDALDDVDMDDVDMDDDDY